MTDKSVVIFAPSPYSLITTSVCELLIREGVRIDAIVIRKFTLRRFKHEFQRDGERIFRKIWRKLVLKESAYDANATSNNIISFRVDNNIQLKSLEELKVDGVEILKTEGLSDAPVIDLLKKYQPDMVVFTGGGLIRKDVLDLAGKGILNCHMGILPEYKGMDVVEWPLLLRDRKRVGVTTHFMDEGLDTGRIVSSEYIEPYYHETIQQLRQRFEPVMVKNLVQATLDVLNDDITGEPQTEAGHQYFIMHPRLMEIAAENIGKH